MYFVKFNEYTTQNVKTSILQYCLFPGVSAGRMEVAASNDAFNQCQLTWSQKHTRPNVSVKLHIVTFSWMFVQI